jgi:4-hydroxybenzoate polyprenyltransferase
MLPQRLYQYARLMRLHKPIAILLLLWPTLWALWLASDGVPDVGLLTIFVIGGVLMRSAGCIINDYTDRHIDARVRRTRDRPLVTGTVSRSEALLLAAFLAAGAFLLVLQCNALTIALAIIGAGLTIIYPFLKRITHLPQCWLGIAFTWGVPMAFAAVTGTLNPAAWWVILTALLWPIIYDTMYAIADREDDIKIGVKSTAILFGKYSKTIIGALQLLFIVMLSIVGLLFQLGIAFYISLLISCMLFLYQQWLIKDNDPTNWVGASIFSGILLS